MVSVSYGWRGGNGSFSDDTHWRSNVPAGPPAGPPTADDDVLIKYRSEAGFPGSSAEVTSVTAGALVVHNVLLLETGTSALTLSAASLSIVGRTTGGGAGGVGVTTNTTLGVSGAVTMDGAAAGTNGFMSVAGNSVTSAHFTAGSLTVGDTGFGKLIVGLGIGSHAAGDANVAGALILGNQAGSNGTIQLLDQDDILTAQADVTIGKAGTGIFSVAAGIAGHENKLDATGHKVTLGEAADSHGTLTVNGRMAADDVTVGSAGTGTFTVSGGTAFAILSGNLDVALLADSSGTVNVQLGAGLDAVNVGLGGDTNATGFLTVTGHAADGARSLLLFHNLLGVGFGPGSDGSLTVSGGGEVRGATGGPTDLLVGIAANSNGTVTVTGSDSIVTITNLQIGSTSNVGTGLVTIESGGKITVGSALDVEVGGTLALSGTGKIVAAAGLVDDGTFDISATTSGASLTKLSGDGSVLLGSKVLTLTNASGTFSGDISGTGKLLLSGGSEKLDSANAYTGGTILKKGTLDLAALGAAGDGAITFGAHAQTLKIENAALSGDSFLTVIKSFDTGDKIDLTGLAFSAGAKATYNAHNHHLTVKSGAVTDVLTLLHPGSTKFKALNDGNGGTKIVTVAAPHHAKALASNALAHNDGATFAVADTHGNDGREHGLAGDVLAGLFARDGFDFGSLAGPRGGIWQIDSHRGGHASEDLPLSTRSAELHDTGHADVSVHDGFHLVSGDFIL